MHFNKQTHAHNIHTQRERVKETLKHANGKAQPRVMAEAGKEVDGSRISPKRMRVCSRLPAEDDGGSRRDGGFSHGQKLRLS